MQKLNAKLTPFAIYEWTGVTGRDPMGRALTRIYNNPIGDARKLYAMKALLVGANDARYDVERRVA